MREVGFVAVQFSAVFPQPNTADSPHVAEWLTFRATLILAVSGGPELDFPQHDADTLAELADFAADFNILGFLSICRHIAVSPDAVCNCSLRRSRCQGLGYVLPAVKDVASPRNHAGDLPFPRAADTQLLENLSRSRP
jgi:hypothetical protein